jgi:hypothetical protein
MPQAPSHDTFILVPPGGGIEHPRLQLGDESDIPVINWQKPKNKRVAGRYIELFYPGTPQDKPPLFEKYCGWAKEEGGEYHVIPGTTAKGWAAEKVEGNVDRWRYNSNYGGWFSQLRLPEASTESKVLAIGLWQTSDGFDSAQAFFEVHKPKPGAHKPNSTTEHHTVVVIIEGDGN